MNLKVVSPIFGFEDIKEIEFEKVDDFFSSLSSNDISFTILDPRKVRDYQIEIPSSYEALLDIQDGDEIDFYVIMILQNPIENSFVNFAAPIIINKTKNRLAQVALDEHKYPNYALSESISNYL
ncbi:MAG: flagellar assembly protein FliW [Sulfurospirillum sp.]|nr:MAG: flagellar assembly protein FliW [Sulfurospirillum sp.]